jgi:CHRD domain-containing protein
MPSTAPVLRRLTLFAALALALVAGPLAGSAAASSSSATHANDSVVVAFLSGAESVPPADPDGSGFAAFQLNVATGEVCYLLTVSGIDTPVAAHIHRGAAGTNGPVVVPLAAPTGGFVVACTTADPALVRDIRKNPSGYYVNVHTPTFPAGAIRGQLHH